MKHRLMTLVILALCLALVLPALMACQAEQPASTVTSTVTSTATATQTTTKVSTQTVTATAQAPINWKVHSFIAQGHTMWDGFLEPFAKQLEANTNGLFKLKLYPSGSIVGNADLTKAVGSGIVEAVMSASAFDVGAIPMSQFTSGLPFSFENGQQQVDFFYNWENGAAYDMINKAYNEIGVQYVAILSYAAPTAIEAKFPISTLADLDGKKIRSSGPFSEALKTIGVQPVNVALGEVYTAMSTGVIDGSLLAVTTLEDIKLKEIATTVMLPYWLAVAEIHLKTNLEAWNDLTPEMQKIFQDTARDVNLNQFIPFVDGRVQTSLKGAEAAGVNFVTLSGAEKTKYIAAASSVWDYTANMAPENAKLVEMLKAYLKSKGLSYPGS